MLEFQLRSQAGAGPCLIQLQDGAADTDEIRAMHLAPGRSIDLSLRLLNVCLGNSYSETVSSRRESEKQSARA